MLDTSVYQNIAQRTDGTFMLGVVGPVRTGKSTFIKRFMETMVIPRIENEYSRERAKDELPQSGSGKTIMTSEPKFIPEEAVTISVSDTGSLTVRLVDCVGYMVDGAAGQFDEGGERMVTTPWFEHEVTMTDAAEKGTHKVITEHSTVGIVITTDGSICDIAREHYIKPEERVINELKSIGKPFVVLLNCLDPYSKSASALAADISEKYSVRCLPVNCLKLTEEGFNEVMECVLEEFPLRALSVYLPDWLDALPNEATLKSELYASIAEAFCETERLCDCKAVLETLTDNEHILNAAIKSSELGCGMVSIKIELPRSLYYETISKEAGIEINNDAELIAMLSELGAIRTDYEKLRSALLSVRKSGYGVVIPSADEMTLEEPKIVRQGGKYSVKLKASAPAIHMLMTNIETEVTPAIGGETASEDIISFLLQGFDGDVNRIWQSNIFGKSLYDIAEEGLTTKIEALPEGTRLKIRNTLQRVINEGCGGLICILL